MELSFCYLEGNVKLLKVQLSFLGLTEADFLSEFLKLHLPACFQFPSLWT